MDYVILRVSVAQPTRNATTCNAIDGTQPLG
jgi:hypothetical protein